MICRIKSFLRTYLLSFIGVTSALTVHVLDRGCIRIDSKPVCAFGDAESIKHNGLLEAGFPPTYMPEYTMPVCQVAYSVAFHWLDVQFDPEDWCLKGDGGEKVACCNEAQTYQGDALPSPYFLKHEGSTMTMGGHTTTWEDAFPTNLKSLKDSKSSMNTRPLYDNTFVLESDQLQPSWDSNNVDQDTDILTDSSSLNAAAAGSTFNTNDLPALDPVVQKVLPDNLYEHTPNVRASNSRLFAKINIPELIAHAAEGDILGV